MHQTVDELLAQLAGTGGKILKVTQICTSPFVTFIPFKEKRVYFYFTTTLAQELQNERHVAFHRKFGRGDRDGIK